MQLRPILFAVFKGNNRIGRFTKAVKNAVKDVSGVGSDSEGSHAINAEPMQKGGIKEKERHRSR